MEEKQPGRKSTLGEMVMGDKLLVSPILDSIEDRKKELTKKMEKQMLKRLQSSTYPMRQLLAFYKCAMMEVETKFRVLDEQFSLSHDRNPIESISARLKTLDHIYEKARRKGIPLTPECIEKGIFDIAGVRVVCPFEKDIYMLKDSILSHDDIRLVEERDYIASPKPSGYRSLHLILEVPIFLQNEKRLMKVEVQLRTMAMDQWASLEHRLMYKKEIPEDVEKELRNKLLECASLNCQLDMIMQEVKDITDLYVEED
ncbi:MAG: GTP pyrophosphokinase family protein [Spirochaetales bacterium]|nr:GTP pyrophosphokinase family protein [Spirochaetales bacterium]